MDDSLVSLSEVIEIVLKAEREGRLRSANSVIVELLQAFRDQIALTKSMSLAKQLRRGELE